MNDQTLLLTNGQIHTLDPAGTIASAIALRAGRIIAVGAGASVATGDSCQTIDLGGRTVLPGLIDAHTHLEGTALHLASYADCHAPPHRDVAGVLGALHAHAATKPHGDWVIGQGSFMLAEKLAEERYPTRDEMDAAVPHHPALIRAGAHVAVVNSVALRLLGIDDRFVPPPGAHVVLDANGTPTGVLIEFWSHLKPPPFNLVETENAVAAMAARLSTFGVTSLGDQFPSATGLRAYQRLRRAGRFPLRVSFTVLCPDLAAVQAFLRYGFERGFGDEYLRVGGIKFFVDGGITAAAGAFYDDYRHQPGNRGALKLERDELYAMVRAIDEAGCQVSAHVVGDRALDLLLDAFAAIPHPSGQRHRLEHAGHLCMTPQRIARIADMGLIPVVTMPFLNAFGDFLGGYLGERAAGAFALRRLLDAGLVVAGSSDSLGAQPESLNPFFGIWCAVARQTYRGQTLAPEEAVSPLEALRTYTTGAAYADVAATMTGSLEPGKLADLIVCDRDPLALPPAALKEFRPVATILGGELVSGALPSSPSIPEDRDTAQ